VLRSSRGGSADGEAHHGKSCFSSSFSFSLFFFFGRKNGSEIHFFSFISTLPRLIGGKKEKSYE